MMKKTRPNLLARQLQDFFTNHMPKLRGISPNTILSYRDALVLFLRFVTSQTKRPVVELDIEDLTPQIVGMFLIHLERDRGNSAATRNVRLSAIHSFFRFVAAQCPEQIEQAQRVLTVPFKKTKTRVIEYLEYDEIQEVLSAVDRATSKGRRDYALLATMFNTGARVQEILNITARDLQLTKPFHVRLFGKGRKERYCPLWSQTAKLLNELCTESNIALTSDTRIFQNCRASPLTRFGVRYILRTCLKRAQVSTATLRSKRLHPHSIRHSTAVALLKSGVDLSTISQWLGHANLETTNRYAAVDLQMKRDAIEAVRPVKATRSKHRTAPWSKPNVLEWLESL
jgi:integrase/recombinase XerD